jgi:cytochrome oxidase assembly protein ShyY1
MPGTRTQSGVFRWDLEWRSALFVVVLVPLFIYLGFWQLSRADEKRDIAGRWEARRQQDPVSLLSLPRDGEDLAYRQVSLEGEFEEAQSFLLDNRIRDGQYGVEVLTPFRLEGGSRVLVNRGWLAADRYRRSLPDVPAAGGVRRIEGYVYVPPGEAYTVGEISTGDAWPRLVQAVDIPVLQDLLGAALWPHTVRLAAESPAALLAEWPLVNVRPEKHTADAVQWFAMAAVLALFGLWRSSNLSALIRRGSGEPGESNEA